jgi:hypothetical protein
LNQNKAKEVLHKNLIEERIRFVQISYQSEWDQVGLNTVAPDLPLRVQDVTMQIPKLSLLYTGIEISLFSCQAR